jgi:lysophospholipase L1-like esterase
VVAWIFSLGPYKGENQVILTFGDSVTWGQGLLEAHKFDAIFAVAKNISLIRAAHSGAVIGTPNDTSSEVENCEVPVPWPSVWQQVQAKRDWSQVQIALLNGGINDVGLTRILNPVTSTSQIAGLVNQFCGQNMQALLLALAAKLTAPSARIALLGYYPIFSSQSLAGSDEQVRSLLELHGVSTTSVISPATFNRSALIPQIVANCLAFWNTSNTAFRTAVAAANTALGRAVCSFVPVPFTEANALWAPAPLLWQLTPELTAEDEVSGPRGTACQILYGDVVHLPQWIQCDRASAGHPNVEGSALIADTLIANL